MTKTIALLNFEVKYLYFYTQGLLISLSTGKLFMYGNQRLYAEIKNTKNPCQ